MKFVILILNLWLEHQVLSSFFFTKVTKSRRKGKPPPCLEFHKYSDDEQLCAVACTDEYLGRSAPWRTRGQYQLLLSHMKHYKEIQSSTIANWGEISAQNGGN